MNNYNVFIVEITYQDTDIGGVVYYANYFNYAEKARSIMLKRLFGKVKMEGVNWVVKSTSAEYKKPVYIDEIIQVKTKVKLLKAASIIFLHEFYVNNEIKASIEAHILIVNLQGKPVRISKEITNKLAEISL